MKMKEKLNTTQEGIMAKDIILTDDTVITFNKKIPAYKYRDYFRNILKSSSQVMISAITHKKRFYIRGR